MPRTLKYPLTPLREHRDRRVDAATAELGEAVRAREAAEEARRGAELDKKAAEARAAAVRGEESARLSRGELSAADLARAEAWEYAARAELTGLAQVVVRAEGQQAAARGVEGGARAALAQEKADLDVVVKDETRFEDRARRAREASEEEVAEEIFAARRREA